MRSDVLVRANDNVSNSGQKAQWCICQDVRYCFNVTANCAIVFLSECLVMIQNQYQKYREIFVRVHGNIKNSEPYAQWCICHGVW